ncbi:D-alanyl-lipoteichoic acid biosynthesis protein DltD [Listeria costaricensis]|uniref:D-alanyl-lipoteichoic acid biosynthesis protein DltD n=1 Tax=Listeria costaricensis TaxID=2026604 RepID=UPI000C080486|nr:D-alanyl-lipoteichoic acid biosynthesis protein DltD [Listeria costaricensis]
MKKKLWMTFGPILVSGILFLFLLFGPSALFDHVSSQTVKKSATSMSENVIQGELIQKKAIDSGNYLPIFGSSELSRVDMFHPSVYAQKYGKDYTPFLIGRPGTQSLSHYLDINALGSSLKGKKVVFILSPQWFQPKGEDQNLFGANFSPLQAYTFALSDSKPTAERRYAAKRLLEFNTVKSDSILKNQLENIAANGPKKPHNEKLTRAAAEVQYKVLVRRDELESKIVSDSKQGKVDKGASALPSGLSYEQLDQLAKETGQESTGNNPFQIKQGYYDKKVKPIEDKLKDSRKDLSYVESPEYGDLQLVMDAFKRAGADVLFINPPINGKWVDYIGMNHEMLAEYYQKVGDQIRSNGFQYVSMEQYQNDPYFLEDPIHLSWRGWVQVDKAIDQFMKQPSPSSYPKTPRSYYLKQQREQKPKEN